MKQFLPILFLVFTGLVKGQSICSPTFAPTEIFYPNSTSTSTANTGYQYLCGPNTVVYDTLNLGCRFIYIDNNSMVFLKTYPCLSAHQVFVKATSTLNIIAGPQGVNLVLEPGATINNLAGVGTTTILCSPITYPVVNCGVGIKDGKFSNSIIKTYPNPVSNTLYISNEQSEFKNSEIEVINYLGQTVFKTKFANEIDVSELSNGYYTLKIYSKDDTRYYSKFIKH